jgi:glycosyltransferase involved in cell wall biosynthesis
MFHELLKLDSNYKLYVVGDIADPELKYYIENFIFKTKIEDNILWLGRIPHERIPRLMEAMNYIICSSIFESQGMGIIEGMSCGLKPVVFNFPGAEQFYSEKWLWHDRTDFVNNILSPDYDSQEYHDYVVDKFSIEKNVWRYKELIEGTIEGE